MPQTSLGQQIRALRKAKRLSQSVLAELAQVSERAIIYWENDQITPGEYELKALLKALQIPASEQIPLLLLLPARRGDRLLHDRELVEIPSAATMPGAGDLLSALRSRQGLSREQVARALGIATTTWGRWENSQYALPDDLLPRVKSVLGASPAEIQALKHSLVFPQEETPFAEETAREWSISFARHRYLPGCKTVDLDALALQRKLWRLHLTHPRARLPLAQVTLDYAVWLFSQNRRSEANRQAWQALSLFAQDKNPIMPIAGSLNLLSVGQMYSTTNPLGMHSPKTRSGLHLLNHWLPSIGQPVTQTMVLTDMAILAGRLNQFDTAYRYLGEAQKALAQAPGEKEDIRCYVQYWYASLLLAQQRPLEALNAMPYAIPDPDQTAPGIGRHEFLLYIRLMLALGEHSQAQKWLSHLYTSLKTVEIPRLRTLTDALARQL